MRQSLLSTPARVLLIAPHNSYRIGAYVAAANRLGIELLIASQSKHPLVSELAEGLYVDFTEAEAAEATLLAEAERRPFSGVVGSEDATVALASRVAMRLELPHNPPDATLLARRKDLARQRLAEAGVPVPWHRRIDLEASLQAQAVDLPYPCVLKPLAMSASRGVIRVDDAEAFAVACARIQPLLSELKGTEERRYLLAEAFIPGTEVAVEGLLNQGGLSLLSLFDKPEPLNGPFFEESYYITPSRHPAEIQARVVATVAAACRAYGLREGPVHAELRINGQGCWILEVAARTIGGQCGRLLQFGTGYGLEELVLGQAMGQTLPVETREGAAGVLMIPISEGGILRRVEGVLAAQKVPFIEDVEISIREGYRLVPLPEGESYLGFIFAHAPSPEQVEAALREANACLNVVVMPDLCVC